jgi:integrase
MKTGTHTALATLELSRATSPENLPAGSRDIALNSWTISVLNAVSELSGMARLIAEIMLASGARVSEILNLTPEQVASSDHILIMAGKGSTVRVAYVPQIHPFVVRAQRLGLTRLFTGYSYKMFRRDLARQCPSVFLSSSSKRCITNIFRRTAAEIALALSQGDPHAAQEFLGHKSPRSTTHYLQNYRRVIHGKN